LGLYHIFRRRKKQGLAGFIHLIPESRRISKYKLDAFIHLNHHVPLVKSHCFRLGIQKSTIFPLFLRPRDHQEAMKSYGLPMEVLETQLQEFGRMPRQRRGDPMLWEISPHLWEGLEHLDDFSILYGMSSFPLTNMFQDG
jgi:hypothetical protein